MGGLEVSSSDTQASTNQETTSQEKRGILIFSPVSLSIVMPVLGYLWLWAYHGNLLSANNLVSQDVAYLIYTAAVILPVIRIIWYIYRKLSPTIDATKYTQHMAKTAWEVAPAVSITLGFTLVFTTGVQFPPNPTSLPTVSALAEKALTGLMASVTTFIGISIWAFNEAVYASSKTLEGITDSLSGNLQRSFDKVSEETRSAIINMQTIGRNLEILPSINPDKKNYREQITKSLAALGMTNGQWAEKINAEGAYSLVWLKVMENLFSEQAYDLKKIALPLTLEIMRTLS